MLKSFFVPNSVANGEIYFNNTIVPLLPAALVKIKHSKVLKLFLAVTQPQTVSFMFSKDPFNCYQRGQPAVPHTAYSLVYSTYRK